jgi:hypothetical protein
LQALLPAGLGHVTGDCPYLIHCDYIDMSSCHVAKKPYRWLSVLIEAVSSLSQAV